MRLKLDLRVAVERLGARQLAGPRAEGTLGGLYTGDMLSWVMAHAVAGDLWLTVLSSINVLAVASLTEVAAVVLCESVEMNADVIERAHTERIRIFTTELDAAEAIAILTAAASGLPVEHGQGQRQTGSQEPGGLPSDAAAEPKRRQLESP